MNVFNKLKLLLLSFVVTLKSKKVLCDCGGSIKAKLRNGEPSYTSVMVYSRNGSEEGRHYEHRCSRKKCQKGFFHGFSVKLNSEQPKMIYNYDDDCLESQYLVTSRETCFSTEYLWEMTAEIICYKATFHAIGLKFDLMHTGHISDNDLAKAKDQQTRLKVWQERISDAWFLYSLIEQKGRYMVDGPVSRGEELCLSLQFYHPLLREKFLARWGSHRCSTPGCGTVVVFDGNMKAQHRICSALKSGVKNFPATESSIVIGCTVNPGTKDKYCTEHKHLQQPCISSNKLNSRSLKTLKDSITQKTTTIGDDTVYIIEGVLDSEVRKEVRHLLIKWESYSIPTWENVDIIPSFIVEHFDRTGDKNLPLPRVKSTRKIGKTVHHRLVYEDDPTLDQWVPLANYTDLGDTVSLSCKTEKDRDKRSHRHSGGIFVGSWPCGVITCFDELWGSEGKAQVFSIVIEWMSTLPKHVLESLDAVMYDDMCHLSKYSKNPVRSDMNDLVRKFNSMKLLIDKFHFKNHVDPYCKKFCNPNKYPELEAVNSSVCEQCFSWSNHYKNCKAMSSDKFASYWLYILDLHNLHLTGTLRHIANPTSKYRMEAIVTEMIADMKMSKLCD